jgi:hypothetical protein
LSIFGRLIRLARDNVYNGDWLKRAVAAQAGIYGNDAAEAMCPLSAARRITTTAAGGVRVGKSHRFHADVARALQPRNAMRDR